MIFRFLVVFLAVLSCPFGCLVAGEERVRLATSAGSFYPSEPSELYALIDRLVKSSPSKGLRGVRAVLVPHAGYAYSGSVAADGFREVDPNFERVFLLASNHRGDVDLSGVSLPRETHYAIPNDRIPLSKILAKLRREPGFVDEPAVHVLHMIEVELPFLSYLKKRSSRPDFEIAPTILGRMDRSQVLRLAEILARHTDERTLFVFSVDLSHYFPDQEARRLDTHAIQAIMSRDVPGLEHSTTDGNQVLLTLMALAERKGWESTFLSYRNSGDATGDRSRVVGYASIAFHDPLSLKEEERRGLLQIARKTVEEVVRSGRDPRPDPSLVSSHPIFGIPRGVFVTLKKNGQLRGCIGRLLPDQSLYEGVLKNAANAAVRDPRFSPVTERELSKLTVSISVLDYPRRLEVNQPADYLKALNPKRDGVILSYQGRQSTFLPQVWEDIPDTKDFLSQLCRKQESPPDCWQDPKTVLYRYGAFEFDR